MEWRTVVHAPEYQVSSEGEIRSIYTMRPLVGGRDKDVYKTIVLCTGGRRISGRFANIVCVAFHGPRPDGMVIRHLDGSRDNNAAKNLMWSTQKENISDKTRHGTSQCGERNARTILTEENVRYIRASTERGAALARRFGVGRCCISAIRTGRNWKHLM